jgi:3-dehydroquinate synthase
MNPDQVTRAPVNLGARSYEVAIGPGLLARAGSEIAALKPKARLGIVSDTTVWALHGAALRASLDAAGLPYQAVIVSPGEAAKSWDGLRDVCEALLGFGLERGDLVIAFGGGVIGDLAGFAAGVLKRGIDFVQIPTTLLAQVDSSVGGKTAIDAAGGKNMIGLFHQPILVLADSAVLATLPERERRAGYAEIIKYGLIDDPAFFAWCRENAAAIIAGETSANTAAVMASVQAKARVVVADEREGGARALLNLGHTFAHAYESEAGFDGGLLHGEAVGCGMAQAFLFSARLGLCSAADAAEVRAALDAAGFITAPHRLPGAPYSIDQLIAHMRADKKAEAGRLTLILARGIGAATVVKGVDETALRAFLTEET